MFKKICSLVLILSLAFSVECFAKPGSSGGSRSSGGFSSSRSSSSRSFSSPSRSSGGFSSKPSMSSPSRSSGGFGSKPSTPKSTGSNTVKSPVPSTSKSTGFSSSTSSSFKPKPSTHVDLQSAKQVKVGNVTMTKDQAISDFKTKHASTYTSSYKSEPSARPSHIPQSTTVGGKSVNVTYNVNHGGYGYIHPLTGAWMAYDVMSDVAIYSALMSQHNYHPVVTTQSPHIVYERNNYGILTIVILTLTLLIFIPVLIYYLR